MNMSKKTSLTQYLLQAVHDYVHYTMVKTAQVSDFNVHANLIS